MSSINEKLDYLNDTKQLIRSSLVQRGQTVDDSTPFRDYASKILNIDTQSDFIDNRTVINDFTYQNDGYYKDIPNPDDYKVNTTVLCIGNLYSAENILEQTAFVIYQIMSVSDGNAHCKVVDILDEYNVGDIKLFGTVEEMNSDNSAKEGDLAVVYREETQNMTVDTQTQYITFPETVTLPEAVTSSYLCMLGAVDTSVMFNGNVSLSATSFRFGGYTGSGMISVRYTSTDGINYTRTTFTDDSGDLTNPVDLGTVIGVYMSEEWNDSIGYFMQIEGDAFEGLYKYDNYSTGDYRAYDMENYTYDPDSEIKLSIVELEQRIKRTDIEEAANAIKLMLDTSATCLSTVSVSKDYKKLIFCTAGNTETSFNVGDLYLTNHKLYYGRRTSSTYYVRMFEYTIETKEAVELDLPTDTMLFYYNSTLNITAYKLDAYPIGAYDYNTFMGTLILRYYEDNTTNVTVNKDCPSLSFYEKSYQIAPTQLTLTNSNQILPDIKAYGKTGVVTGDGSIYDNLDMNVRWKLLSGDKLLTENLNDWTFIGMTGSNSIIAGDVVSPQPEENYYCAQIKQEYIFEEGFNAKFSEILGETYVDNYADYVGTYNNQLYFLCLCAITENSKYSVKLVRFNLDYSLADVNEIIQFNTTAPSNYVRFRVATDYSTVLFSTNLGESTKAYLFDVNTLEYTNIGGLPITAGVGYGMLTKGDYCYVLTRTGVERINLATKTYEQSYMTFSRAEDFVFQLETDSYVYFGYETSDNTLSIVECIEKRTYLYPNVKYPDLDNTVVDNETNVAYIYKLNTNSTTTVLEVSETGIEEVTYTNKGKKGNDYESYGYWFKDNNNLVLIPFTRPGLSPYFLVLNPVSKTITYGLVTRNYDAGEYYKDIGFNGGSYSTNPKYAKTVITNDCIKRTDYTIMADVFILLYKNCSLQKGVLSNTVTTGFACNDSDSGIVLKTLTSKDITDVFNPVDYTGTISPEEYTTALGTSEQILGKEETVNE